MKLFISNVWDGKFRCLQKNEEEVEFYGQINEVKRQISEDKFWHIHKSYLVNKNYIAFFPSISNVFNEWSRIADQQELQGGSTKKIVK